MKIGDKVEVMTKYFGRHRGVITAVDPNGSVVVRHNGEGHPTGATYAHPRDVVMLVPSVSPDLDQFCTYTKNGKIRRQT